MLSTADKLKLGEEVTALAKKCREELERGFMKETELGQVAAKAVPGSRATYAAEILESYSLALYIAEGSLSGLYDTYKLPGLDFIKDAAFHIHLELRASVHRHLNHLMRLYDVRITTTEMRGKTWLLRLEFTIASTKKADELEQARQKLAEATEAVERALKKRKDSEEP